MEDDSSSINTMREIADVDVPDFIRFLEFRERVEQREAPPRLAQRFAVPWYVEPSIWVICCMLPKIYVGRHQRLNVVIECEHDIWNDRKSRLRATYAWRAYCDGLVDEWNSANIITALILSAAGSFLSIADINDVSRYALIFALLSSLASIAHATVYAHLYRTKLSNRNFHIIQLTRYIKAYCFIDNVLLCLPLLCMYYAIAAFSISILAYLWPSTTTTNSSGETSPTVSTVAKIIIPVFFGFQLCLIAVSYYASHSLTFGTDELMDAKQQREIQSEMRAQRNAAELQASKVIKMPIVNGPEYKGRSSTLSGKPVRWVRCQERPFHIPKQAVPLGYENGQVEAFKWENEQQFAARTFLAEKYRVGKAGWHLSSNVNIPLEGTEQQVAPSECDVLCGDISDFAWFEVKDGEPFDPENTKATRPYEWMYANPTDSREVVYVAAANWKGGRHIGEVMAGDSKARIPWEGSEELIAPFYVLLVKSGAMMTRETEYIATNGLFTPTQPTFVAGNDLERKDTDKDVESFV